MEVGTLLLQFHCQLFVKLSFAFKLSGLNGYLKGYLKSRINKLPKKYTMNIIFLLTNAHLLKILV